MATATLQPRRASAVPSASESQPAQVRARMHLTEQPQPQRRRRQQQQQQRQQPQQHKQPETATAVLGPRLSGPTGARALATAGGIMVAAASAHPAPAASALAAAAAAPAPGVADPSAGPVYRYRKRKSAAGADAAAGCTGQVQQGAPLLFSRTAGQVYVLLEPIVGMEGAKPHADLHMAAPIVVLNMNEALSPVGGASGADVLFRPHSTKRVAVKRIDISWVNALHAEEARGGPLGDVKAFAILGRSPPHPHVISLIDSFVAPSTDSIYLVMPYADGGELFALVAESVTGLPPEEACKYLTQIVAGLMHLKDHGLAHGDISLENVMLEKAAPRQSQRQRPAGARPVYNCRLIDFGLARRTPEREGTPLEGRLMGGKAAYVSPEVVDGTVRDWHAADVWALGVCLYNLLTALTLYARPDDKAFRLLRERDGARRLLWHHIQHAVHLDPAAAHLIACMLNPEPALRPTFEEILQHPWVVGGGAWGSEAAEPLA